MQKSMTIWLVGLGFVLLTACGGSKGDKDGDGAANAASGVEGTDSENSANADVDLSARERFLLICNEDAGEASQHQTISAIKTWFINIAGAILSCSEIYSHFNNPSFLTELHLIGPEGGTGISDISVLAYFSNLGRLDVAFNSIEDYSPLRTASNLQILRIFNTELTKVPSEIAGLPLTTLVLDNAPITDFSALSQLTSLQALRLGSLNMSAIPQELSSLSNLEALLVDGNPLDDFSAFSSLTGLVYLSLDNTGITTAPSELGSLSGLLQLDARSNQFAAADFSALAGLADLEVLRLNESSLSSVPGVIADLDNLSFLDIGGNDDIALVGGYAALNGHPGIEALGIAGNGLTAIPNEVATLVNLEGIDIRQNNIESISPLAGLSSLSELLIEGNPIDSDPTIKAIEANCPLGASSPAVLSYCGS